MQRKASSLALITLALLGWRMQPHDAYAAGSHQHKPQSATMQEHTPDAPIRITMEELHQMGGVPPGWAFRIPEGDAHKGRKVFLKMECYRCHGIAGEKFPTVDPDERQPGPDLTGMGVHHPREYFAESIISPNRIIIVGEGYTGSDGLSTMPSYNADLTVAELVDLVAYLKGLGGPMIHKGMEHTGKR